MSRSQDNGCGKARCGLCKPHKRYKHDTPRVERMKASDKRNAAKDGR